MGGLAGGQVEAVRLSVPWLWPGRVVAGCNREGWLVGCRHLCVVALPLTSRPPCFLLSMPLIVLPSGEIPLRRCRATHWKQTVFYLKDTLIVHQGEAITGGWAAGGWVGG